MPENDTNTQTATATADTTQTTAAKTNKPDNSASNADNSADAKNDAVKNDTANKADADTAQQEPELKIEDYGDLGLVEEEGVKIDVNLQKSFKEACLKNKISPQAAKEIAKLQFDALKKQQNDYKALQESWQKENETTYGDNLKNVQTKAGRVLAEIDKSGKFKEFLELAGATNHPATLGFLNAIGDRVLEKASVNPSATVAPTIKELEDFYKN